ncbi:MAG: bifunctional [glutamate--ammonia ligase]-adenylyl-L-tyrosine phosphorylase/[glutamate--ammonia-ligase] adenylyltransferase [Nitrospirae bacterium]|nr:bifunctional [glutamate--ammonia ligase]-adenylyl-L-tyrosine phosphorylase/[glutamate--ammonia-ligase] adenylyltransferase [Nitrospirota bacterium]MCL5421555.1 bifunctional [glutamate--ammonia ligase]-adenylyl-L-tyrosine phosphorylase/[glutamate--ammonia-ligase] adenylyltransferase [Nitrospirota bacterium]
MMLDKKLRDAALSTPDPERAYHNLCSFCDANPELMEALEGNLRQVSLLFSISQFLANFASSHPDALFENLGKLHKPVLKEALAASLREEMQPLLPPSREALLGAVRRFKKRILLLLTLRDILNITDIVDAMSELSLLADVILEESVKVLESRMKETYGEPKDDAFAVIAVGKLGGNELNFSSDIDLLYVYGTEQGETSGIMTSGGIMKNRISNHEYYCKLGEQLNKFLSMNTEDGFVYRVDLRLRPEGQRGSLAQSLSAYEIYYESWGMAWERAVLLRARPDAGDVDLGKAFTGMIRPFIYRKYLDFSAIDEIRRMKTKIDAAFKKDDIKRGYGGIREIEFFVQALQLIYGGKEPLLRERGILMGLHRLLQKNLIGHEDYSILNDNYIFLRKLEHRLQQLNDLQTHSIPADKNELTALGRKMGHPDAMWFLKELEGRRKMVRNIYDSLFMGEKKKTPVETSLFFSEDLSLGELKEVLAAYPLKDPEKAVRNIIHIKDAIFGFQTLRGRRLLSEILPAFLHEALETKNPDTAIHNLQSFATLLASEESYLELFKKNKSLIPTLTRIFSRSEYLLKNIMKRPEYLELLGHELFLKKTLASLKRELRETIASGTPLPDSIRILRQSEEIRLGTLFLEKKIDTVRLVKGLSKAAEAVVSVCTDELVKNGVAAIGMGKAGGREITFDSDLDLVFACSRDISDSHVKAAQRLIRLLTSYTKDGIAYRVDVRLRPDGTKGPLVTTLDALDRYYSGGAHFWEFQALLKARPLGGDMLTGRCFMEMRGKTLSEKGKEVPAADIRGMRERIQRELSKEREGYDIKLGPGGIEELEFTIQYLQLIHCEQHRGLTVQGTLDAVKRLDAADVIAKEEAELLCDAYLFYRSLESFLRLRGQPVLRKTGATVDDSAEFMGFRNGDELLRHVEMKRTSVRGVFEKYLR